MCPRFFITVSVQNVSISVVLWHVANTLRSCSVVVGFLQVLQIDAILPSALPFLGTSAKLRKSTITFVVSVCLSVRMEQLDSHPKDFHEILCFLIDCRIYTQSWTRAFQSMPSIPLLEDPLSSLIILSNRRSSEGFLSLTSPHQNPVYTSLVSHTCHMPCPSYSSSFYHPNNIWWEVQIRKFLFMYSSALPLITSSLIGQNVLPGTLLSNTLSWHVFLNVRDQFSHP